MRRRRLLGALAAGAAAALAGCTGGGPPSGDGSGDTTTGTETTTAPASTATDAPTPTDTATTPGSAAVIDSSFELGAVECGAGRDEATVVVDGTTVSVDGVMRGSDGCARARLGSVDYAGDTLTVAVESDSESGVCKQCIVDVNYAVTVRTDASPGRVVVTHDGEPVAEEPASE